MRVGWDVLSLGSKQYKLAHGNRGFKKLGKMAERVGRCKKTVDLSILNREFDHFPFFLKR